MKNTRRFALLLCVLMLFAMFAGCSRKNTGTTSGTDETPGNTTTDNGTAPDGSETFRYTGSYPIVEQETTLEWYCTNGGSLDYDWESKEWLHTLCEIANIRLDMTLIDSAVYNDTATPCWLPVQTCRRYDRCRSSTGTAPTPGPGWFGTDGVGGHLWL